MHDFLRKSQEGVIAFCIEARKKMEECRPSLYFFIFVVFAIRIARGNRMAKLCKNEFSHIHIRDLNMISFSKDWGPSIILHIYLLDNP